MNGAPQTVAPRAAAPRGIAPTPFAARVLQMARSVEGKDIEHWPAWSTGERLAVALVLDDPGALRALGYTMVEAFARLDGELSVRDLRAIEVQL